LGQWAYAPVSRQGGVISASSAAVADTDTNRLKELIAEIQREVQKGQYDRAVQLQALQKKLQQRQNGQKFQAQLQMVIRSTLTMWVK
jgi:hypothetical protein